MVGDSLNDLNTEDSVRHSVAGSVAGFVERWAAEIQNNWNLPQWKHHRWEEILEVTVGVAPCPTCFFGSGGFLEGAARGSSVKPVTS